MAAVGGGLSASAVLTGINTSTTARCRFPARPCTSRSQVRSEKRLRIGRLETGNGKTASKGPRPVNIGLTLQEDPSLVRLLRIAEKHKRKREAGFDSSGSEEEDSFAGFGADGGRSLRSTRSLSQTVSPLKSVLSPAEKPPPAPDLNEEKDATSSQGPSVTEIRPLYGKVVKRGEKIRKDEPSTATGAKTRNASKPKLVVKFAVKRKAKEVSPPKTVKGRRDLKGKGPGAEGRQPAKGLAKKQKGRKSVNAVLTNDEVEELNAEGSDDQKHSQQGTTSTGTSSTLPVVLKDPKAELAGPAKPLPVQSEGLSQKKQSKVVWTLTLVKGRGKTSAVKVPAVVGKGTGPMLGKFVKRSRPVPQEEGSGALDSGNSLPSASPSSGGQRRNPSHLLWIPQKRRTKDMVSSSAAVSPKPVGKQRRVSKGAEGSPEEGAEAGRESGHEPSDQPAASSGGQMRRRAAHYKFKKRRALFGRQRKPGMPTTDKSPETPGKHRKPRQRMVCYNYEPMESLNSENQKEQQEEESHAQANTELTPAECTQSVTPVVSGRSSRVIKTPKRFLDDERMSHLLPKRALKKNGIGTSQGPDVESKPPATKPVRHRRKSQDHEDAKGEGDVDRFQEDNSTSDAPRSKGSVLSPGAGNLKFYERLKKLTTTLAQKKVQRTLAGAAGDQQGETGGDTKAGEDSPGPVRKRRKSKLTIEDIQSPGVVRKLAVHLNVAGATLPGAEHVDAATGDNVEGSTQMESEVLTQRDLGERVLVEQEGTTHRISVSSSNKRMFHLLKRAKVQLIKIDQQKQLKSSQLLSGSVQLGESTETTGLKRRRRRRMVRAPNKDPASKQQQQLLTGPRIKHVCRAAAVALGQPRAIVPDDIPRLSALPMHEREGIAPSPTAEDVGEVSDNESVSDTSERRTQKGVREYGHRGSRSRRCLRCPGCLNQDDCSRCVYCLDKPKFGGPNKKRQCCIHRICSRIALKKAMRMGIRNPKVQVRRGGRSSASGNASSEEEEQTPSDLQSPSPSRKQPRRQVTPLCYSDLLRSAETDSDESTSHQPIHRRTPLSNGNAHYTPVVGGWSVMTQSANMVT